MKRHCGSSTSVEILESEFSNLTMHDSRNRTSEETRLVRNEKRFRFGLLFDESIVLPPHLKRTVYAMQSDDDYDGKYDSIDRSDDDDEGMTRGQGHSLFELIERREWGRVYARTPSRNDNDENDDDNEEVCRRDDQTGQYPLHALCCIGAAPLLLIKHIASLYPPAIAEPESQYGDTCLHILCRTAQCSHDKLATLLKLTPPATIAIRNRLGGTALHSAANHNATIETMELLLHTYPPVINVRTPERRHALEILYAGFTATIHGHVHMIKILNHPTDDSGAAGTITTLPQSSIFDRF
jgi:hypothetical protein